MATGDMLKIEPNLNYSWAYTLYMRASATPHFRELLLALPHILEIVEDQGSMLVFKANPLYSQAELTTAITPLVGELAADQA